MAVEIKILGQEILTGGGADEYAAAMELQECFHSEFSKTGNEGVNGTILIKPNFKANGFTPEDIDIVIWMNLDNYSYNVFSGFQYINQTTGNFEYNNEKTRKKVIINSMLLAVELKSHTQEGVIFTNNDLKVSYNGRQSSAIEQSNGQKYSLVNYIRKNDKLLKDVNPRVNNLVWMNQLTVGKPWGCQLTNILMGKVNFKGLMEVAFEHVPPYHPVNSSGYFQNAFDDRDLKVNPNILLESLFINYDKEILLKQGDLSRKKLERVVQGQLEGQNRTIFDGIGQKTTILKGVPGSGKTINLMHFAYHLAATKGKRCLILTYNRALMADIRYLAVLSGFKDDPSSATVGTNTCMRLMRSLMIAFGVYEIEPADLSPAERSKYIELNFFNKYEKLLVDLLGYLNIANQKDLDSIKVELDTLNWEIILIDESQDWYKQERDILYLLFGKENFVISYGSFQLMRQTETLNWLEGTIASQKLELNTSYRQKSNLCSFLKPITHELDIPSNIKSNKDLLGGRVKIYTKPLKVIDYKELLRYCMDNCKNAGYDVLVLVNSQDELLNQLRAEGSAIHDGTLDRNKDKVPTNMEASRIFNYNSCRGLEGWVVIANNLDVFLQKEINEIKVADEFKTLEQTKQETAGRWLYMILSRPIDTLVITLKNTRHPLSQLILRTANQKQDYCQIIT